MVLFYKSKTKVTFQELRDKYTYYNAKSMFTLLRFLPRAADGWNTSKRREDGVNGVVGGWNEQSHPSQKWQRPCPKAHACTVPLVHLKPGASLLNQPGRLSSFLGYKHCMPPGCQANSDSRAEETTGQRISYFISKLHASRTTICINTKLTDTPVLWNARVCTGCTHLPRHSWWSAVCMSPFSL